MRMGAQKFDDGLPEYSSKHPPTRGMWAVPVDELRSRNTELPLAKDVGATLFNTLPALTPSSGAISPRVPPTLVPQTMPRHKEDPSRLPAWSAISPDHNPQDGFPDAFEGKSRYVSKRGLLRRHEDIDGFAVARARQRLHSFRTARESMSRDFKMVCSHENVLPRQFSVDRQEVMSSQDESRKMLSRLKEMRHHATKGT